MPLAPAASFAAEPSDEEATTLFVADQVQHDNNLFRLPDELQDLTSLAGSGARREDLINRMSAGFELSRKLARQGLKISLQLDDNRFNHNDDLDHVSGKGGIAWDWQTRGRWSGKFDATRERRLAGFGNNRDFIRDLLTQQIFEAGVRYGLGPRFGLIAGAGHESARHDAGQRQVEDLSSTDGSAGIEFRSTAGNTVALRLGRREARFPRGNPSPGQEYPWNFREDSASVQLRYAIGTKTTLEGSAGTLARRYAGADGDFSGGVWRLSLHWSPTSKLQLMLVGWRELQAYVDAQSDFFVARGISVAPAWSLTQKLRLEAEVSWQDNDYTRGRDLSVGGPLREDGIRSRQLRLLYAPGERLSFTLAASLERRDSNQLLLDFDDRLLVAGLRLDF